MSEIFGVYHHARDTGRGAGAGSVLPGVTRRRALQVGAAAVGSLAAPEGDAAAAAPGAAAPRSELSFDEGWRFFVGDPAGAQGAAFDDRSWRALDLPHDWSIEDLPGGSNDGAATNDPSPIVDVTDLSFRGNAPARIGPFDENASPGGKATGYTIGGVAWYRKRFRLSELAAGERVLVRFDGVYCNSDVWVNGSHLGFHPNGYTPFWYDLTPHLRRGGENVVAVRVNNASKNSRWYSGSGMYRHTWLTRVGAVHVPLYGVAVTTPQVGPAAAVVRADTTVANASSRPARIAVRVTVYDGRGRRVASRTSRTQAIRAGEQTTVRVSQRVRNVKLWSPDSPSLYSVRAEVLRAGRAVDSVVEAFGIRSISFSSKGFFLNGQPVKLHGGCVHHDHGPMGAVSLYASEERRIRTMKAAGFNAIRTAHNCPSPELLKACDRVGMLVYDELTDMWDAGKSLDDYHLYFAQWWQRDAASLVMLDRNHPSVVIRSIGNEVTVATAGGSGPSPAQRGPEIAAMLRKFDPTRPVTQGGGDGIQLPQLGDNAASYCDVGDVHYIPDYSSTTQRHPGKAWIQSESNIASLYDYWKMVTDHEFAVGDFSWAGWDYLGEAAVGHPLTGPPGSGELVPSSASVAGQLAYDLQVPYPWYGAGCGDIDQLGQLRPQMLYRRVVWGLSNLELLVQRPTTGLEAQRAGSAWFDELESWTWTVSATHLMTIRAYTPGDRVQLLLNGAPVASIDLNVSNQRIAQFTLPYTPGTLTGVAYRSGHEIGRKTLQTAGPPAKLRLTSDLTRLTTDRDQLAHVLVQVLDAHGRLVPDAVVPVSFSHAGAGAIVGITNGNPHNVDSFKRPHRYTYHGKVLAVLRPAKTNGELTLTALAPGLRPATLTLPVTAAPSPTHANGSGSARAKPRARTQIRSATNVTSAAILTALGAKLINRRIENAAAAATDGVPRETKC